MFQNINPLAKTTAIWEIALMLLGAFILGYLFSKLRCWGKSCSCDCNNCGKCSGVATKAKASVKTVVPAVVAGAVAAKATHSWAANTGAKDDLKKVEGIGPAIEKVLNAANISTFAELAKTTQVEIRKLLDNAGSHFQIHDGETWAEQAGLLRDGKMAEFETLVEKLKGGKRV
jgi:predicted flap endonuclease-1-like 5' DNA nuclease